MSKTNTLKTIALPAALALGLAGTAAQAQLVGGTVDATGSAQVDTGAVTSTTGTRTGRRTR